MKGPFALKPATALAPCQPAWEAQGPSGAYAQNDRLSSFAQDWGPWGHGTFCAGTRTTGHPVSCTHTEVRGSPFHPRPPPQLPHHAFFSEAVTLQRFIFTH